MKKIVCFTALALLAYAVVFGAESTDVESYTVQSVIEQKEEIIIISKKGKDTTIQKNVDGKTVKEKQLYDASYIKARLYIDDFIKSQKLKKSKEPKAQKPDTQNVCAGNFYITVTNPKKSEIKDCFDPTNSKFNKLYFNLNRILYEK